MYPSYLKLYKSGELKKRIKRAYGLMESCRICPRNCRVNRREKKGYCRAGLKVSVSSFHLHFGEEPPISGYRGSGTIFFTYCNLRCVFCQNYPISHLGNGNEISPERLSDMMIVLQKKGAHNINLVTPTHFVPQILFSLDLAIEKGLQIPLVYNCGGYESVETLKLLEEVVDIYMPDIKYGGRKEGEKYSSAPNYFEVAKKAVKEMHRQVGNLKLNKEGIAKRGLLVRHLILPNGLAETKNVFNFVAKEISPQTYVSIMSQYFPAYKALYIEELNRKITLKEYNQALKIAEEVGLENGWRQD
ncbi:radical SAM protein [Candidatus Aerophobetes bacterium]|nr:radical SAM protein [Candidatus Aerophobetes bacterium]